MSSFMWDGGEIFYGHDVDVSGMTSPVRCLRCHNGVYDLAAVTVTERYTDCSMWRTPCCNVTVDDRTWTVIPPTSDWIAMDTMYEDDVPFHLRTSCQMYGHIYEDTGHGTRRCNDCEDEYELDEEED